MRVRAPWANRVSSHRDWPGRKCPHSPIRSQSPPPCTLVIRKSAQNKERYWVLNNGTTAMYMTSLSSSPRTARGAVSNAASHCPNQMNKHTVCEMRRIRKGCTGQFLDFLCQSFNAPAALVRGGENVSWVWTLSSSLLTFFTHLLCECQHDECLWGETVQNCMPLSHCGWLIRFWGIWGFVVIWSRRAE